MLYLGFTHSSVMPDYDNNNNNNKKIAQKKPRKYCSRMTRAPTVPFSGLAKIIRLKMLGGVISVLERGLQGAEVCKRLTKLSFFFFFFPNRTSPRM